MKNSILAPIIAALVLTVGIDFPASAKRAELILFPTRIIMEGSQRTATVTLKNSGDATGQFTVDTLDMIMPEDGVVHEAQQDEAVEFSAKGMTRVSPRSMSLAPGESQVVRILVRQPDELADGEYRTHLRVKMVNDNADVDTGENNNERKVEIHANLALVIPIIVRQGQTSFQAALTDAKLITNGTSQSVQLYLNREGNQSSMGDLKVMQNTGGGETLIGELNGVPVYRPTKRRLVNIPLGKPASAGTIKVLYNKQTDNGGTPGALAETTFTAGK